MSAGGEEVTIQLDGASPCKKWIAIVGLTDDSTLNFRGSV